MNQFLEPSILGLLEVNFRFPKPAFIGDTISVRIIVADRKETSSADRGIIEFERQGINQHGETVCICMVKMLVARQPADSQNYRSEEHTSELQSLMRISYAVLCLKKKNVCE